MDPDPQRNAYQRKPETSKRKCNLLMDLDADRRRQVMALFFPFAFRRLNLFRRKISHRQRFHSAHATFQIAQFVLQLKKRHVANPVAGFF